MAITPVEAEAENVLLEFYKDYANYLLGRCTIARYRAQAGLCFSARVFLYKRYPDMIKMWMTFRTVLKHQFIAAELDVNYPFNDGSAYRYNYEYDKTKNTQRREWVFAHAGYKGGDA